MPKPPDTVVILDQASGYLQIDMLEAYASQYNKRVIVAGTIVERGTALSDDIKWHRITKYDRSTTIKRISTWLGGSLGMFWIVLTRYRKAHIVAITNPPFSVFVPWLLGCSYDVVVYDMYPDALVQYGYAKPQGLIYNIWSKLNRLAFENARKVFTLTDGMKKLTAQYVQNDKDITVVPLWSDASDFKAVLRKENTILKQTGGLNKFNIVYSGNLGVTHPVERLVELAEFLDPNYFGVIIIGGGAKKKVLEQLIKERNYTHVHLLPWQPIELLTHNLYAGHINVVTLDKEASDLSIPSKTFNILSIGNPILGVCSVNSGLADLIKKYDCGIISEGNNLEHLADELKQLQQDKLKQKRLKANSLKASEDFTPANAKAFI